MTTTTRRHAARLAAEVEVLELEVTIAELERARLAAAEVDVAELELLVHRRALLAGLPKAATRSLYAWERLARTDFAGIETDLEETRQALLRRLTDDREAFADLLAADLGRAGTGGALARRLEDLEVEGLGAIPGVADLIDEAEAFHRDRLEQAAGRAADRVRQEATAQGVDLEPSGFAEVPLAPDLEDRLDRQARRLATGPHGDAVRTAREAAIDAGAEATATGVAQGVREMSARGLDDYANTASIAGEGAGREAGVRSVPVAPRLIYASELLDSNTCRPCSYVDGTEYDTLEESLVDYPEGRFRECEGGARCRGTRVFVWADEAAPTIRDERPPEPPPEPPPAPPDEPDEPPEPPAPEARDYEAERRLRFDEPNPLPGELDDYVDVNLKGMTPAARDEYVDVISRLAVEYPDVFADLGYVGTSGDVMKMAGRKRTPGGVWGVAIDRQASRGQPNGIGLNPGRVSSPAKLEQFREDARRQTAGGWFADYGEHGGVRSTMTHEYGHLVYYRIKRDPDLRDRFESRVNELLEAQGVGRVFSSNPRSLTAESVKARHAASREVGKYATTNNDELFAESFASWKLGDDPVPMARAIGQAADELLKGRPITPGGPS